MFGDHVIVEDVIHKRESNGWQRETRLNLAFNESSISGTTAIFSGMDDLVEAGEARVFTRGNTDWALYARLLDNTLKREDQYGGSTSIDGNYAIVGQRGYRGLGEYWAGAAYVYQLDLAS